MDPLDTGPLVHWSIGPWVYIWSTGPWVYIWSMGVHLVHGCTSGPLVHGCVPLVHGCVPLVHWSMCVYHWSMAICPLVHWSMDCTTGPLVHWSIGGWLPFHGWLATRPLVAGYPSMGGWIPGYMRIWVPLGFILVHVRVHPWVHHDGHHARHGYQCRPGCTSTAGKWPTRLDRELRLEQCHISARKTTKMW